MPVQVLFRADTRARHLQATDVVSLVAGTGTVGYGGGITMRDDGTGGDSVAADGIYSALANIPAGSPEPLPYGYRINGQQATLQHTSGLVWVDDSGDGDSPQVQPLDAIALPGLADAPATVHKPAVLRLATGAPNPFRSFTRIRFVVPGYEAPGASGDDADAGGSSAQTVSASTGQRVLMEVFDVSGRRIRTLLDGYLPPGDGQVSWDGLDSQGRPAGNGLFFCRMRAAGSAATIKMMRVR